MLDCHARSRGAIAVAAMLGASALIAATSLIAKVLGLGSGVAGEAGALPLHPLQISAGRYAFALLFVTMIACWYRPTLSGAAWGLHVARSLFGWLGVSCLFAAAARMPLAAATAISFLSPLVAMAAAFVCLGDRAGPLRWAAAAVSLIGALILIRPGTEAFQPAALIALGAACFMGLEAMVIKRLSDTEPAVRILLINNAVGTTVAAAAAFWVWTPLALAQVALLAALGVTMAIAQVLFIQAMKAGDASYVMPFFYSTLLFAALYDFALFGDHTDLIGALGALVIIAGAVLLLLWDRGLAGETER